MRFNRLDLNLLVALDALLTECSITRAADKVHLSQSSMSYALGRLREHFNDELLVQIGRKMELTPRAKSLRDPIRDVLVRISATIDNQPAFDPATSDREFVLHVSDYSMEVLCPHVFALAEAQRSKVRFRLLPQTGHPTRSLERGEVDLLLIPESYCSPDHPTETVLEERFVTMMWRDSSFATGEVTMEQYIKARHLTMEPSGGGQPAYETWLVERFGIKREIQVRACTFTALPAMLVGTEMLATVHARIAERAIRAWPLRIAPLPFEMPLLVLAMQWHKHRTLDPGLVWLRDLLKEAANRMRAAATDEAT